MNKDLRMALQKRKIFNLDKNHLRKRKCPEREVQGISGKRSLFLTSQNKKTPEFQKIPEDKRSYTLVAEDLERSGIFDDNDTDIVHDPTRKVLTNEELAEKQAKKAKKKNNYNLG